MPVSLSPMSCPQVLVSTACGFGLRDPKPRPSKSTVKSGANPDSPATFPPRAAKEDLRERGSARTRVRRVEQAPKR